MDLLKLIQEKQGDANTFYWIFVAQGIFVFKGLENCKMRWDTFL